jgi:hypothetical protein
MELSIAPPSTAPADQPLSPLDAGAGTWTLTRWIQLDQAQFCGSSFAARGALECQDQFPIARFLQAGP